MNHATGKMRSDRGFTAIEITAVATIIAILALLLIPLLQDRVEKAKLAAANNDLTQLMKVQMLVFADTNRYARLQDLDNTQHDADGDSTTIDQPELAIPHAFWNIPMTTEQRDLMIGSGNIEGQWQGPYLAFNKYDTVWNLLDTEGGVFFWGTAAGKPMLGGPILLTKDDILENDRYPVDPWGNPYLFYGPGKIYDDQLWTAISANPVTAAYMVQNETEFSNCAIYSLGPDGGIGSPNDGFQPPDHVLNTDNLRRAKGVLGNRNSDDLMVQF